MNIMHYNCLANWLHWIISSLDFKQHDIGQFPIAIPIHGNGTEGNSEYWNMTFLLAYWVICFISDKMVKVIIDEQNAIKSVFVGKLIFLRKPYLLKKFQESNQANWENIRKMAYKM